MSMIAVTGGSGFFGTALVKRLLAEGERVRVLDRAPLEASVDGEVEYQRVDIRDRQAVLQGMRGCDVIYHNAAVVPISRAGTEFWAINRDGTRHVLDGARAAGARRVIHYSTSSSLYGMPDKLPVTEETKPRPIGDYGHSKHEAEEICRQYRREGLNISIVRPRTIVGAGRLGIFQILFEWIRNGRPVYIIGKGTNRLQLIGVNDLVEVSLLLRDGGDNEDFNIGAEVYRTFREDLEGLIRHAGSASRVRSIPAPVAKPALRALDALNLSPFVDLHYTTIDKDFYFDIGKARRLLGWRPKESNDDCLTDAYDWYRANAHEIDTAYGTTHRFAVRKKLISLLP